MITRIAKKLEQWRDAGLITPDQFEKISEYEKNQKSGNIAAYTVIALGGIVVSIGIISLIAFNWDEINNNVKLFMDFLVLLGIALGIMQARNSGNERAFHILTLIYMLFALATIGLVSQVFNTGGKWYQAAIFWAVITFPLASKYSGRAGVHIWFLLFLPAITEFFYHRLEQFYNDDDFITLLMVFIPFLSIIAGLLSLRLIQEEAGPFRRGLLQWGTLGIMGGTVVFQFMNKMSSHNLHDRLGSMQLLLVLALVLLLIAIGLSLPYKKLALSMGTGLTLYLGNAVFVLSAGDSIIPNTLFFIAIWFSIAFSFLLIDSHRLFDFSIAVIGIRFLILYFEVFKDLADTGFFLIFSGLLIIGAALLYLKKKDAIAEWMRSLI